VEALAAAALAALADWPVAAALRGNSSAYAVVNAAHILGLALLVGPIAVLDARLLGLFRSVPVAVVAPFLARIAAVGLLAAVAMGFLLFSVRPDHYAANPAFLAKVALVALGTLNALALRRTAAWRCVLEQGRVGLPVRIAAAASLAVWVLAVLAGRLIAFVE
jgi:hypothetical protein